MKLLVGNQEFEATTVRTPNVSILLIVGQKGLLGCGYVNHLAGDRFGDAVAIVRGVSNYEEMLNAKVVEVNETARRLGVEVGMLGREALERF